MCKEYCWKLEFIVCVRHGISDITQVIISRVKELLPLAYVKNMQTSKSLHQMSWLVYCDFNRSVCFKSYIVKKVSLTQGQLSFKAVKMGRLENILPLRSTQHFVVLFLLLQGKKYHNIVMDSQKRKLLYIIH